MEEQVQQVETPVAPVFVPSEADQAAYEEFRRTGKAPEPTVSTKVDESGDKATVDSGQIVDSNESDGDTDGVDSSDAQVDGEKPKKMGGFQRKLAAKEAIIAEQAAELARYRAEQAKEAPVGPPAEPEWDYTISDADNQAKMRAWARETAKFEAAQEVKRQTVQGRINSSFKETALIYPDFDAKVGATEVPPNLQPVLAEFFGDISTAPGLLAYHLASNPQEVARIAGLSPRVAMIELARIEAKLETPSTASERNTPRTTQAAPTRTFAPVTPIKAASAPLPSKRPDQMDQAEYEAWRQSTARR